MTLHFENGALSAQPGTGEKQIPYDGRVGLASGDTGYFGRFGGLPLDQQEDDRHSLVYDTAELKEEISLYGAAEFAFDVQLSESLAQISLRISDVSPDGKVSRVAFAIRNLALDDMLDHSDDAQSTSRSVRVRFHTTAYRFKRGHRIRLSLAASYWPLVWPAPTIADLRFQEDTACLQLPVLDRESVSTTLPTPKSPPDTSGHTVLESESYQRRTEHMADGAVVSSWHQPTVSVKYSTTQSIFSFETSARHSLSINDPLSAQSRFDHTLRYERPDGTATIQSWAAVGCDRGSYHLTGNVTVFWNEEKIFSRDWSPKVPRRCS